MRLCVLFLTLTLMQIAIVGCGDQRTGVSEVQVEVTSAEKPPEAISGPDDDRLELKSNSFDPELSDSRPYGAWSINKSEAVTGLDVLAKDPRVAELQQRYPNYTGQR